LEGALAIARQRYKNIKNPTFVHSAPNNINRSKIELNQGNCNLAMVYPVSLPIGLASFGILKRNICIFKMN
jgi:hypothetical protein